MRLAASGLVATLALEVQRRLIGGNRYQGEAVASDVCPPRWSGKRVAAQIPEDLDSVASDDSVDREHAASFEREAARRELGWTAGEPGVPEARSRGAIADLALRGTFDDFVTARR